MISRALRLFWLVLTLIRTSKGPVSYKSRKQWDFVSSKRENDHGEMVHLACGVSEGSWERFNVLDLLRSFLWTELPVRVVHRWRWYLGLCCGRNKEPPLKGPWGGRMLLHVEADSWAVCLHLWHNSPEMCTMYFINMHLNAICRLHHCLLFTSSVMRSKELLGRFTGS